uniref:Uncharacterized protein n=1 Tax=Oryza brachyantha TaxID=4533 RepID=J3MQH5_ORYBR
MQHTFNIAFLKKLLLLYYPTGLPPYQMKEQLLQKCEMASQLPLTSNCHHLNCIHVEQMNAVNCRFEHDVIPIGMDTCQRFSILILLSKVLCCLVSA